MKEFLIISACLGVAIGAYFLFRALYPYNRRGFDKNGYHRNGTRYDNNGYDVDGYNAQGYNEKGYDRNGYDANGYDRDGYNAEGYNRDGYDKNGLDAEGYNRDGFDKNGLDAEGYNRDGYNANGYNREKRYNRYYDIAPYRKSSHNAEGLPDPRRYPVGRTIHSQERLAERLGMKSVIECRRIVQEAYYYGQSARQVARNITYKLNQIEEKHGQTGVALLYKGYVFIFSKDDNSLITVYEKKFI